MNTEDNADLRIGFEEARAVAEEGRTRDSYRTDRDAFCDRVCEMERNAHNVADQMPRHAPMPAARDCVQCGGRGLTPTQASEAMCRRCLGSGTKGAAKKAWLQANADLQVARLRVLYRGLREALTFAQEVLTGTSLESNKPLFYASRRAVGDLTAQMERVRVTAEAIKANPQGGE
jgi:hypothetical protein